MPMPTYVPAEIGAPLSEIDTPSLILDLDAFERNLDRENTVMRGILTDLGLAKQ